MKILFPFPEPLPLPRARGIQVAWVADGLCRSGVELLLAHVPSADGHPLAPTGRPLPPGLRLFPISNRWPFPFQRWHSAGRFVARLRPLIARERPDALFVRHVKLADRLLHACPALPLIYEAHEVFAAGAPAAKRAALAEREARVLAGAAGVVYISEAVRRAVRDTYAVTAPEIVLHSGVEPPATLPDKDWSAPGRHIIYAGSFYPWKGVDDLIMAASRLPGYRITLIGGDPADLARLQAAVSPGGAEVELLPRRPASEIQARLASACIAVLPNRAEGVSQFTSPLKLFEAMGAGCALVAADLPSLREVVPAEHAAWFAPGDPAALADALARLASDPARARADGAALRTLASDYTWTARGRALASFGARCLAARAHSPGGAA